MSLYSLPWWVSKGIVGTGEVTVASSVSAVTSDSRRTSLSLEPVSCSGRRVSEDWREHTYTHTQSSSKSGWECVQKSSTRVLAQLTEILSSSSSSSPSSSSKFTPFLCSVERKQQKHKHTQSTRRYLRPFAESVLPSCCSIFRPSWASVCRSSRYCGRLPAMKTFSWWCWEPV